MFSLLDLDKDIRLLEMKITSSRWTTDVFGGLKLRFTSRRSSLLMHDWSSKFRGGSKSSWGLWIG